MKSIERVVHRHLKNRSVSNTRIRSPVSGTITISVFDDTAVVVMKFQAQLMILESANVRFESLLFDIRQIVQADLFDSEIEIARELKGNGFLRPAGAVSGIVLEKHLAQVCQNHNIVIRKKILLLVILTIL